MSFSTLDEDVGVPSPRPSNQINENGLDAHTQPVEDHDIDRRHSPHRAYVDPYRNHQDPPERYPLPYSPISRSWTYYPALLLVFLLGGSIPASVLGVGWCIATWSLPSELLGRVLLLYAVLETGLALLQAYRTHLIQPPSPPSDLSPEECLGILTRILQSGTGLSGGAFDGESEDDVGVIGSSSSTSASNTNGMSRLIKLKPRDDNVTPDPIPTHLRRSHHTTNTADGRPSRSEATGGYTASPLIPLETLSKDDPRAIEFRERLRNWFGRVPFSQITLLDAQTWLSWSCCGLSYEQVRADPEKSRLIDTGVQLLQARTGWKFPQGIGKTGGVGTSSKEKDANVRLMRLTMDPVRVWPRPLWWYAALWAGDVLAMRYIYRRFGLRQYKQGQTDYLLRIPKGWNPEHQLAKSDPIIFIHGLGFGLLSPENMLVIRKLCKTLSSHPILIPLQPQISQQFWDPRHLQPTPRKQFVGDLLEACKRWNFYNERGIVTPMRQFFDGDIISDASERLDHLDGTRKNGGVVLLSHSNGSVAHTWMLKDVPGLTKRNALVDPVVFCSWEGDLCYNFCYRPARSGLECLLKYLIAAELGIANSIQRHFDWSANTLFTEEIPDARDPEKTLIVLGGTDIIVDAKRVRAYLKRHGLHLTMQYDPTKGHTDGLRGTSLDRLIIWLATGKSVDVPSASALQ